MRIPVNFHMTFPPTPVYIGRLLQIADGTQRTVAEIAELTGIPEGKSTGKVKPHIYYAVLMGLIGGETFTRTQLGQTVWQEDGILAEKLTQLLCHVRLTSVTGAAIWHFLFRKLLPENNGSIGLSALSEAMQREFGPTVKYVPAITTYTKQFTKIGIINADHERLEVIPVPVERDMSYVYAYALLYEWEAVYADKLEITETELSELGFSSAFGWSRQTMNDVLTALEKLGVIRVNRQLVPFTVQKISSSNLVVPKLYSLLL
mgnify:CR=1 FL=1